MKEQTFKIGDKIKAVDIGDFIYITHNKIYEVVAVDSDAGNKAYHYGFRFELVENDLPPIEEQIKLAKSYLNKSVRSINSGSEGIAYEIFVHIQSPYTSGAVLNFYKEHGYCVEVKYSKHSSLPVTQLELAPEFKELKLNDNYTVKVYDDRVEVGCQTFPINAIKELAKLIN